MNTTIENIIKDIELLINQGTSIDDILVVSQKRTGELGSHAINPLIQAVGNPPSELKKETQITVNGEERIFRIGDRVIQTVNNYSRPHYIKIDDSFHENNERGIFNGEIGKIVDIKEKTFIQCEDGSFYDSCIVVKFDNFYVLYDEMSLSDLQLAYVLTIYNSQGIKFTEFPIVMRVE